VFGVEADDPARWTPRRRHLSRAVGALTSFSCRARHDLRQHHRRVGVTGGIDGRTLVYVKGGAAWLTSRFDVASTPSMSARRPRLTARKWGWTAGLGVEQALTRRRVAAVRIQPRPLGGPTVTSPDAYVQPRRRCRFTTPCRADPRAPITA